MDSLIKIGNTKLPTDPNFDKCAKDGHIIDIRQNDYYIGKMEKIHFAILRTNEDYWTLRGTVDWKSTIQKVLDLKKYLYPVDSTGRLPWEALYLRDEERLKWRDWYINFEELLASGLITQTQYDRIYDHDADPGIIVLDRTLDQVVKNEYDTPRSVLIKNQGITSGTYTIGGTSPDYSDIGSFFSDVNAGGQMDGNLTGEHRDAETTTSAEVDVDTDTNGYILTLKPESGAECDGSGYNGARINFSSFDGLWLDETTGGDLDDVVIEHMAWDISGGENEVALYDGGDSGVLILDSNYVLGDSTSYGVRIERDCANGRIINNIITGHGASGYAGIKTRTAFSSPNHYICNNTCIGNVVGIFQDDTESNGTCITKNNLCQNNTTDFVDDGGGFGTTGHNVSEDATSPDASYQSKDVHTNSVFKDYAGGDYRLDSGGDSTNLAILDDGEDLSGVFTTDIENQTRSTWYIGASEIVAAGGGNPWYYNLQQQGGMQ